MKYFRYVSLIFVLFILQGCQEQNKEAEKKVQSRVKPNILLIVVDDMGYSDIGPFGGEIRTPHLNKMAKEGVTFTNFYTAPACSPTRSMLLTGNDNHVAGLGSMAELLNLYTNLEGKPGYEGHLNDQVVPFPELLKKDGYHTFITGKWHLGDTRELSPVNKGFEETFVLMTGGASHWSDEKKLYPTQKVFYQRNGKVVKPDKDFYSTRTYTQKMIEFINKYKDDGKPFFAYLAYTAPHDPLQVPDDWIGKYKGRYDNGYDELRKERYERLKKLGFVGENTTLPEGLEFIPAWETLSVEQKKIEAKKMEIYAAMIEYVDDQVGKLLKVLENNGQLENTIIFFLSDNGANGHRMDFYPGATDEWLKKYYDNSYDNIGRRGSGVSTGPGWAQASMSPFKYYKTYTAEGGIRTPFLVWGYGVNKQNVVDTVNITHVMDIAPTVLEMTGIRYPKTYKGKPIKPILGKSLLSYLKGVDPEIRTPQDYLGWELFGNRALRQGKWKLLWIASKDKNKKSRWELYDLEKDPGESKDLSKEYPEKYRELLSLWDDYVKRNGVIIPVPRK
jgi:arylsulfatase